MAPASREVVVGTQRKLRRYGHVAWQRRTGFSEGRFVGGALPAMRGLKKSPTGPRIAIAIPSRRRTEHVGSQAVQGTSSSITTTAPAVRLQNATASARDIGSPSTNVPRCEMRSVQRRSFGAARGGSRWLAQLATRRNTNETAPARSATRQSGARYLGQIPSINSFADRFSSRPPSTCEGRSGPPAPANPSMAAAGASRRSRLRRKPPRQARWIAPHACAQRRHQDR